jgi:hypothetical protein
MPNPLSGADRGRPRRWTHAPDPSLGGVPYEPSVAPFDGNRAVQTGCRCFCSLSFPSPVSTTTPTTSFSPPPSRRRPSGRGIIVALQRPPAATTSSSNQQPQPQPHQQQQRRFARFPHGPAAPLVRKSHGPGVAPESQAQGGCRCCCCCCCCCRCNRRRRRRRRKRSDDDNNYFDNCGRGSFIPTVTFRF